MTGFVPQISGVGNDRSTNCTTTTAPFLTETSETVIDCEN